jgi:hypothetical protein
MPKPGNAGTRYSIHRPHSIRHKYCCFVQLCDKLVSIAVNSDQSTLTEESLTMNRIQQWFEQIAGVSRHDRRRWAQAQEIFGSQRLDMSALQKPACWRRKSATASPRRSA